MVKAIEQPNFIEDLKEFEMYFIYGTIKYFLL